MIILTSFSDVFSFSITVILLSSQDSTECESGCQCPSGLLDDGKGSCVKEHECSCWHNGHPYAPGKQIPNQCNYWYDFVFNQMHNIKWLLSYLSEYFN